MTFLVTLMFRRLGKLNPLYTGWPIHSILCFYEMRNIAFARLFVSFFFLQLQMKCMQQLLIYEKSITVDVEIKIFKIYYSFFKYI